MAWSEQVLPQCEQELLHLSGAIQAHGALIALAADGTATHASENIHDFTGWQVREALGKDLGAKFASFAELGVVPGSQVRGVWEQPDTGQPRCLVTSRTTGGGAVVELTTHTLTEPLGRLYTEQVSPESLLARLADTLRYDRLMYYAFREDGDGEVLAELRRAASASAYLGLRFPASDIPQIARSLYRKNPWRQITDAQQAPCRILGLDGDPPDLTWSDLRSVSPVHCAYLANMGVRASLSIPIIIGDELIALVACHADQPLETPAEALVWARQVVDAYRVRLQAATARERMRLIDRGMWRWKDWGKEFTRPTSSDARTEMLNRLLSEFSVDCVALKSDGSWLATSSVDEAALEGALSWAKQSGAPVNATDNLARDGVDMKASGLCGVMALAWGKAPESWLLLFRKEYVHEVAWGGRPSELTGAGNASAQLGPRRSFERWVEIRRHHSRSWTRETQLLALQLKGRLQELSREA